MPIKNNNEFIEVVHELEDKYSYVDEFGRTITTAINIPDNDPKLLEIHEYVKKCTKEDNKRMRHYEAFDYDGQMLAASPSKVNLIKKLKKVKSLKKMFINKYQIDVALEKNHGKLYWGYIVLKNEDNI